MGKYTPLTAFLKSQRGASVVLTFAQVERIIADKLPPCARKYRNTGLISLRWWDNLKGATEADARLAAGFQTVMVDMENEKVKLRRIKKPSPADLENVRREKEET